MKVKFFGYAMAIVIALIIAFNINLNLGNNDHLSLLKLANINALAQDENSDFKYAIDKDKPCDFYVSGDAEVSIIKRLLGIKAKAGAYVDVSSGTSLYKLGGSYRLGDDITCAKVLQSFAN